MNQTGDAITIPVQAIDRTGDQTSVVVLQNNNTVQTRPITLGVQNANYAEVATGLAAGERIVVSDRTSLKSGEQVTGRPVEVASYEGRVTTGTQ
jgi:hypothetical protein